MHSFGCNAYLYYIWFSPVRPRELCLAASARPVGQLVVQLLVNYTREVALEYKFRIFFLGISNELNERTIRKLKHLVFE